MATTRSIRYIETTQVTDIIPLDSVTSTSTSTGEDPWEQGSAIINGGQTIGYNYDADVSGLGNWASGPPPVYQTPTTNKTYYPTTEKIKFTYDLASTPLLIPHSSGIPATQCWARIYPEGISVNITPVNASPSNLSYATTATFDYSYRKTAQFHRVLTDVTETRTGGLSINSSASGDLFKVGSDAYTAKTGTTTNDFTLSPSTDDLAGRTIEVEAQTRVTYATQGGPLSVTLRMSNWHIGYTSTLVRSWEGRNYIFDGSDADHTIPTLQTTSTMSVLAGLQRQGEADLEAVSSLDESSALIRFSSSSVSSNSTANFTGNIKSDSSKQLIVTSELIGSTYRLIFGSSNLSAISSSTATGLFKPGGVVDATAAFTQTSNAGLIYDINADYSWNTFNLNIYFESGFVEDGFVSDQGEYNWNFLETTGWDDWPTVTWTGNEATWDNWPDDVWETTYTLDWLGTLISTPKNILNIGNALEYTGAFSLAEESAFEKASSADLNSAFTTSFTASGIINVSIDMAGAFAPDLAANIITDIGETITLTGVFTPILTASAITDLFADIDAAFTFEVIPTHRPGPYQLELQSEITDFSIVPTFKPGGFADLIGFATQLSTARLFFSTDPYNIWSIKPETRIANIAEENRQTIIDQEKRVNIISAETRLYLVPQETRRLKLKIPPFKNRTSMPRVRAEQ
jgi:hypothetical protein